MNSFQEWAERYRNRPDVKARLNHKLAKAIVQEEIGRSAMEAACRESMTRGLTMAARLAKEATARNDVRLETRKKERREAVATPSAEFAGNGLLRTQIRIDKIIADVAELKPHCAGCGNDDVVVGVRDEYDELGCNTQYEGAFCWRCGRFDDVDYVPHVSLANMISALSKVVAA